MRLLLGGVIAVLLGAAGCYRPGLDECAVRCGAGSSCPSGLTCDDAEGFCQANLASSCSGSPNLDGGVDGGADADVPPGLATYTSASAGDSHACAIRTDKTLWCWGRGDEGQVGDGLQERTARPVQVDPKGPADWLVLETGEHYTCAIRGAALPGELTCWGNNDNRQIEDSAEGTVLELTVIPGAWKAASGGAGTTCAIDDTDHLWCWGGNGFGILGATGLGGTLPRAQIGSATWRSVAVGLYHACAIRTDGALHCWGSSQSEGFLGTGTEDEFLPKQVGAATDWAMVAVTDVFTCAIREAAGSGDRTLWCWGRNSGNLGLGGSGPSIQVPTQVGSGKDWATVAVAGRHACGVRAEAAGDRMYCWGLNGEGSLGVGDRDDRLVPTRVGTGEAWAAVTAGRLFSCALDAAGALHCFGEDVYGQLGDGHAAAEDEPQRVGAEVGWTEIATGPAHTCGIRDGGLYCWGLNRSGQIGASPSAAAHIDVPRQVAGTWTKVALGQEHTCAIDTGDDLYCWGLNDYGQLGTGDPTNSAPHPVPDKVIGGAAGWSEVAANRLTTCAIGAQGGAGSFRLYCWGANEFGQAGNNEFGNDTPIEVNGAFADWVAVTEGYTFTCGIRAIETGKELWCFGDNDHGQLGDGVTGPPIATPQAVNTADKNWAGLDAGFLHVCAGRFTGEVSCWGANGLGMLGNNDPSQADVLSPGPLFGGGLWRSIAGGEHHTCAVSLSNRELSCWGNNEFGQLGDGNARSDFTDQPNVVSSEQVWERVDLGFEHSCGIRMDGSLWCWGRNTFGQVGNGQASSLAPARIADPAP